MIDALAWFDEAQQSGCFPAEYLPFKPVAVALFHAIQADARNSALEEAEDVACSWDSEFAGLVFPSESCDIRIDRTAKWGNPFRIGYHGTREEVVKKYTVWLAEQPDLIACLPELVGKRLGCWCAPSPCHGDVLVRLIEELGLENVGENHKE